MDYDIMDYYIELEYTKGKWRIMASFESPYDRDFCFKALQRHCKDCNLRATSKDM